MTHDGRHEALELETMLLSRYLLPGRRPPKRVRHLERSAYTLLRRLQAEGPMTIAELSEALDLDVSTLNRQTAAMLRCGDLERVPDPDGGVARKFRPTPAGEEHLRHDLGANVDGLRRVVGDWPEEDLDDLVRLLRRFNGDIERLHGRPWPRG
ncbi:MarR family winged helix-turn-helix transcriptional regulator [Janibacter melonis]|uniref:MarR family winged helix-turn-helix transcriptional regulator n=1 Tax=Janibacter melonis TaxID=262209 RepID=UPI001784E382|nr:MarR family transcriptional regulator [Janibacter melonis]